MKSLTELSPFLKYMNQKTRKEIIYSNAASMLLYGAKLYTGQTKLTQKNITTILMKYNQAIFSKDWYKVSNIIICKAILVDEEY